MFTVCPKCALTLVVTAADLRVAQGYVRCGRCSSVFNALARLSDERTAGTEAPATPPAEDAPAPAPAPRGASAPPESAPGGGQGVSAQPGAAEEAIPDEALEFDPTRTDVSAVFVDAPPNPQWTAATGSFKALIAQEGSEEASPVPDADLEIDANYLSAMLRAEDPAPGPAPRGAARTTAAPARSDPRGEAAPRGRAAPPARAPSAAQGGAPPPAPSPASPHEARPRTAPAAPAPGRSRAGTRHAPAHRRPHVEASAQRPPEAPEPPPQAAQAEAALPAEPTPESDIARPAAARADLLGQLSPNTWRIGSAAAALLLLVQVVNHYRDDLAASARLNRPLTALYGALGVRLMPRWDVRAYDVHQLGASVEPGASGLITVRASIKNSASRPQPLPLLRVTLQDRFGNRIASSDVAPRFYLPPSVPASSFLSGGQRIDAEMGFVDPGANAVGFEIDACLPASGGGVTCANDVSAR